MLAVYGLRREDLGTLDATRLMDSYIRRRQWEAKLIALEHFRMMGEVQGQRKNAPYAAARTPDKYKRVPPGQLLKEAGVKIQ